MLEEIRKYIYALEKEAIPQLSINCVIMGFNERQLHVIVNRIKIGENMITVLPGGYVKQKEDLSDSVVRVIRESTGLQDMLLRQFAVFGKARRSFASEIAMKAGLQSGSDRQILDWFSRRFISLCYVALVDFQAIELKPTAYFESAEWFPVNQAEELAMDHGDILHNAREFLYKELPYSPVVANLLPSTFTLPEFQALMEALMNRKIDRPNFRRKIIGSGILEKVGLDNSGKRRPADIYRFIHGRNTTLINEFKYGF